jgi:hypothetical protein
MPDPVFVDKTGKEITEQEWLNQSPKIVAGEDF